MSYTVFTENYLNTQQKEDDMVCFVYITAGSMEEAEIIGRNLVSRRLAACVNIINNMKSIYQWEGKVETADEVVLIAKSKEALVGEITESVKSLHSYKCPCIVSLQVENGNPDFLNWVRNETK